MNTDDIVAQLNAMLNLSMWNELNAVREWARDIWRECACVGAVNRISHNIASENNLEKNRFLHNIWEFFLDNTE